MPRRSTPIGLTKAYWENPSRPAQVRAFARRAGLEVPETSGEFAVLLGSFLSPVLDDLRTGAGQQATWAPGGCELPTTTLRIRRARTRSVTFAGSAARQTGSSNAERE